MRAKAIYNKQSSTKPDWTKRGVATSAWSQTGADVRPNLKLDEKNEMQSAKCGASWPAKIYASHFYILVTASRVTPPYGADGPTNYR